MLGCGFRGRRGGRGCVGCGWCCCGCAFFLSFRLHAFNLVYLLLTYHSVGALQNQIPPTTAKTPKLLPFSYDYQETNHHRPCYRHPICPRLGIPCHACHHRPTRRHRNGIAMDLPIALELAFYLTCIAWVYCVIYWMDTDSDILRYSMYGLMPVALFIGAARAVFWF